MVIAIAGEAISIKGTKNGLVIVFNPNMDIEEIKNNLKTKMETSKGFFAGARFTVHNSSNGQQNHHYINELEGICRQYGLIPSVEVIWPSADHQIEVVPKKKKNRVIPIRQQGQSDSEKALLITHTLRSGQKVFSQHNIVILADVNPGAEIVSESSIYVIGACKGYVHAGCDGNLLAEVFAIRMQPIMLRIGSIFAETANPIDCIEPTVAKVIRGKVIFNKF